MSFNKFILCIVMFSMVSFITIMPFVLIFNGCIAAIKGHVIETIAYIVIGLISLRLIKPISIITGKDYKIF